MGKFKVIAGLGNKDIEKTSKLILLWMRAGADIFDTSCAAMPEVQKICLKEGFNLDDFEFCVSVSTVGDIHGKKAKIDPIICTRCGQCKNHCIENAINPPNIDETKCIGCSHCKKACKYNAISLYDDVNNDFKELMETDAKIDTIEFHISIKDKKEILKEFKQLLKHTNKNVKKISICLSRKYFSNTKTEKLLNKMKEMAEGFDFVVQTDGNSMNNGANNIAGTMEAVSYGLFVKSLGYNVILSGGCNEYTAKLAHDVGLDCSIAFGSFIRKMTNGLNDQDALKCAKEFVKTTKEILND